MAEIAFTTLEPEVRGAAPLVPSLTIVRELRRAAIELCRKALCYRTEITDQAVAASTAEISLTAQIPTNTVMVRPIRLTIAEREFRASSASLVSEKDVAWLNRESTFPETYWPSMTAVDAIRISPQASSALSGTGGGISGIVAIQPSRAAVGVEEIFLERYQDALIDGALGRLLNVPNTDWLNPQTAGFHKAMFNERVLEARADADNEAAPDKDRTGINYGGIGD